MVDDEAIKRIEQLHKLRSDGVITDEDFERSKERILHSPPMAAARPSFAAPTIQTGELMTWFKLPLQRYADFNGRSRRKEFWLFQLIYVPITLAAILFAGLGLFSLATVILGAAIIGLFIPQLALQVRRFHDQDKSGWFVLFNLVPYVGGFVVLVFMCLRGTPGPNRFGDDPVND